MPGVRPRRKMTEVLRADPGARRQAVLLVMLGALLQSAPKLRRLLRKLATRRSLGAVSLGTPTIMHQLLDVRLLDVFQTTSKPGRIRVPPNHHF